MIATAARIENFHPINPAHVNELDNSIIDVNPILEEDDGRAHASFDVKNNDHSSSAKQQDKAEPDIVKGRAQTKKVVREAASSVTHEDASKENNGDNETRRSDNKTAPQHQQPLKQDPSEQEVEPETSNELMPIAKSAESYLTTDANNTVVTEESEAETADAMNSSLTVCAVTENEKSTSVVTVEPAVQCLSETQDEQATTLSSTAATFVPASPSSSDDGNNSSPVTNSSSIDSSTGPQTAPLQEHEGEESAARKQRQVCFSQITIRRYPMTLGDNPSCRYGAPVSLDWDYDELPSFSVDDYEIIRAKSRRTQLYQLVLSYYRRHEILSNMGFEEQQLKIASRQVARTQRQRTATKFFLPVSKVEEIAQSAGRKVKRARSKSTDSGRRRQPTAQRAN